MTPRRYAQAAAIVRDRITAGTLRPGEPAPSGAELARITGYAPLTCRRALRALIADGTLTAGPAPTPAPASPPPAAPPQPPTPPAPCQPNSPPAATPPTSPRHS
jgi:DNA-binding transcriptional MocR family regulator